MCNSLVLFISSVKKVYIESTETKSILIRLLSFLRVLIPQRLLFFYHPSSHRLSKATELLPEAFTHANRIAFLFTLTNSLRIQRF